MPEPPAGAASKTVKVKDVRRDVWIFGFVLGLAVLALAVMAWLALLHQVGQRIASTDFSEVNAKAKVIGKQVELIRKLASIGAFPSRRRNLTSVGAPLIEKKLITLSRDSRLYESRYDRLPLNFEELKRFGLPQDWEENVERLAEECQIVPLTAHSTILNCDGWARPSADELNLLVRSFDSQTEQFYEIDRHVLLYIPPLAMGIAVQSKSSDKHE